MPNAFDEIRFPETISYGSRGGPSYKTTIVEMLQGHEQRIIRNNDPLHEFDVRYGVKSYEDLGELLSFYNARQGCARGFRYKDWNDFTTNLDGYTAPSLAGAVHPLVAVPGLANTYQLFKLYTWGGSFKRVMITKPVAGSLIIAQSNVDVTGSFTIDYTTGRVVGSGGGLWSGEFDKPVRFAEPIDDLFLIDETTFGSCDVRSIPLTEIRISPGGPATDTGGVWYVPTEKPTSLPPAPPINCALDCPTTILAKFYGDYVDAAVIGQDCMDVWGVFHTLERIEANCEYTHPIYSWTVFPVYDGSGVNPVSWHSEALGETFCEGSPGNQSYNGTKASGGCAAGTYSSEDMYPKSPSGYYQAYLVVS